MGDVGCFAPFCDNEGVALGNDILVNCPVAFCEDHVGEWGQKDNIEIIEDDWIRTH
jgi:hypothetical protein